MHDQNTLNGPETFEIISSKEKPSVPLIVHIPHSSIFIPESERLTFCLSDQELKEEFEMWRLLAEQEDDAEAQLRLGQRR